MLSLLVAVLLSGAPQDIPSPYSDAIAQGGQRQLEDTLARRRLQQAQRRSGTGATTAATRARQRQACASLPRFAAQHGRDHPKVVQLTGMCRRDGYIR